MAVELVPGGLWNVIGSVVIVALGVAVARVRPRGRPQVRFALLAVLFGVGSGLSNLNVPDPRWLHDLVWAGVTVGYLLAGPAAVALALAYAGPPSRPSSWFWTVAPVAVGGIMSLGALVAYAAQVEEVFAAAALHPTAFAVPSLAAWYVFHLGVFAAASIFALWARGCGESEVRQAALMSSALVIYSAWAAGSWAVVPHEATKGAMLAIILMSLVLCGMWVHVTRRGVASTAARNAALLPLAALVAGLLANLQTAPWTLGLTRIAMAAILGYAIVRHKALGIDATLRFGISKGTVAGVVLAAIFVASEAAAFWFGQDDQWIGLVVGGMVVFAISPLQRMADRLADRAVPGSDAPAAEGTRGLRLYEQLVQRLAADGELSPDDRHTLAHVAQEMGLGAGDVHDVLHSARPRRP